jgi:hypothetical protein
MKLSFRLVALASKPLARANLDRTQPNDPCSFNRDFALTRAGIYFYDASGLSNTITLDTKAFTSRMCVRPRALDMARKSSAV